MINKREKHKCAESNNKLKKDDHRAIATKFTAELVKSFGNSSARAGQN